MRHEHDDAIGARARHQDVGGLGGAVLGAAIILDLGMVASMPENARDHRPFRHLHPEQWNARARKWRFDEERIGDQLRLGRESPRALLRARPPTREHAVELLDEIV